MFAKIFLYFCLSVILSSSASAQSTFGNVLGTLQDQTGLPLAQVMVQLISNDDNSTRSTTSADDGSFQFLNVKPGHYEVIAQKPGFSDSTQSGIVLDARQS